MSSAEEYAEAVLVLVESVPAGRATTYGAIADVLQERLGTGGPRTVARVMATDGSGVPWWRCVRADGTLPGHLIAEALQSWYAEGTPLRGDRVDLPKAFWQPVSRA
jgi:alkylated DNA nucleotide flippase Atl1